MNMMGCLLSAIGNSTLEYLVMIVSHKLLEFKIFGGIRNALAMLQFCNILGEIDNNMTFDAVTKCKYKPFTYLS